MTTQPTPDDSNEVASLRAERDELQAEMKALRRRARQRGRWRRMTVVALVVLACVVLTAAVVGLWARRNFLDTDRFVDRAGPLIEEPSVQQALGNRLTGQLMTVVDPQALFEEVLPERGRLLAAPLANAVEGFVRDRVVSFMGSDRFERLWVGAVRVAHEAAIRVLRDESEAVVAEDGQVTLNLLPVVNAVLQRLTAESPEILGREVDLPDVTVDDVPDAAIARLEDALGVNLGADFGQVTVYDDGKLEAVQETVNLFDRLVVWLLPLGLVLAAVALWLSTRRRRTLLQLSAGLALGMVLMRRIGFRVQDEVASLPPTPEGRRAVAAAAEEFLHPLTTFAAWTLAVVGVVAAVAVLTGNYPWVVSLRRRVGELWKGLVATTGERARDEATVAWIGGHRDVLLIGGVVVGLVLLWVADLSWAGLLLVFGLVAAFEVVVYRITARPAAPPPAS
jgi:hypothetical protein